MPCHLPCVTQSRPKCPKGRSMVQSYHDNFVMFIMMLSYCRSLWQSAPLYLPIFLFTLLLMQNVYLIDKEVRLLEYNALPKNFFKCRSLSEPFCFCCNMKATVVLLFLTIYLVVPASTKEVFINNTAITNCTLFECWFFDATFWVNGSIPEANDEVFITDIPTGNALNLNSSISLSTLYINSDFQLIISGFANVSFFNLTLSNNAQIYIIEQAQVYGLNRTAILNSSEIKVEGIAFAQAGVHFYLDEFSTVRVDGYLGLYLSYNIGLLTTVV
jgi:hypothetical protein